MVSISPVLFKLRRKASNVAASRKSFFISRSKSCPKLSAGKSANGAKEPLDGDYADHGDQDLSYESGESLAMVFPLSCTGGGVLLLTHNYPFACLCHLHSHLVWVTDLSSKTADELVPDILSVSTAGRTQPFPVSCLPTPSRSSRRKRRVTIAHATQVHKVMVLGLPGSGKRTFINALHDIYSSDDSSADAGPPMQGRNEELRALQKAAALAAVQLHLIDLVKRCLEFEGSSPSSAPSSPPCGASSGHLHALRAMRLAPLLRLQDTLQRSIKTCEDVLGFSRIGQDDAVDENVAHYIGIPLSDSAATLTVNTQKIQAQELATSHIFAALYGEIFSLFEDHLMNLHLDDRDR